jgi:catechol 2,3-dioxygenase-like lactoylglutathione lyase family enzyme
VNGAPPNSYVTGVTIAITVEDTEKTARYYREVLGVDVKTDSPFVDDAVFGPKGAQYRESVVALPEKSPPLHFLEFKGVDRKALRPERGDREYIRRAQRQWQNSSARGKRPEWRLLAVF